MSIVNQQDDSTDHEKHACSGRGFQHTCLLCTVYIYSCRNVLEVHRYFSVHASLFCRLFFSVRQKPSLVIKELIQGKKSHINSVYHYNLRIMTITVQCNMITLYSGDLQDSCHFIQNSQ